MELETQILHTALDATGLDEADYTIRNDYSGRGMYGDTCFAIDMADMTQAFQLIAAFGAELADDAFQGQELARRARTDSMGFDIVLYFPGVQLVEDGEPVG